MHAFTKPSPFDHPSSHIPRPAFVCVCVYVCLRDDLWVLAKQASSPVFVTKYQHAPTSSSFNQIWACKTKDSCRAFPDIASWFSWGEIKTTASILHSAPFSHIASVCLRLCISVSPLCAPLLFLMAWTMFILMVFFFFFKYNTSLRKSLPC